MYKALCNQKRLHMALYNTTQSTGAEALTVKNHEIIIGYLLPRLSHQTKPQQEMGELKLTLQGELKKGELKKMAQRTPL